MVKVDYKNGKIYKLINSVDDKIYIGSTAKTLAARYSEHKYCASKFKNRMVYSHLNSIEWDNVKCILIENYPCKSSFELRKQERYHYRNTLKENLLNMDVPFQTKEDLKNNYDKHNNKPERKEYMKKYAIEHQEEIKRSKNKSYIKNQEKYLEDSKERTKNRRKEKINCICGSITNKHDQSRNNKTLKHLKYLDSVEI